MTSNFTNQTNSDIQKILRLDLLPENTPVSEASASKFSELAAIVRPGVELNFDQEALLADLSGSSEPVDFDLRATQSFRIGEGGILDLGDQSIAIDSFTAQSIKSFYGIGSDQSDEFGEDYVGSGGHDIDAWFDGGLGDDKIYGGSGDDELRGGAGNDYLEGSSGSDYFVPGAGADFINGFATHREGVDALRLDFQAYTSPVELLSQSQTFSYKDGDLTEERRTADVGRTSEGDVFIGVEKVYVATGSGNDIIDATYTESVIQIPNKNFRIDSIEDERPAPSIETTFYAQLGAGNDTVTTTNGDDVIDGEAGRDIIITGAGNDVIEGGFGDDVATGGVGADIFILEARSGVDTIVDFSAQEGDRIAFKAYLDLDRLGYDQATGSLSYEGRAIATLQNAPSDFSIQEHVIAPQFGAFTLALEAEFDQLNGRPVPAFTPVEIGGISIPHLFDEGAYLDKNGDVAAAVSNGGFGSGYEHFVNFGWLEGREPNSLYDEEYYLSENADVANAVEQGGFQSGLHHFLLFGHREDRSGSAQFDAEDYLTANPDVKSAVDQGVTSAFEHYVEFGLAEGRAPGLIFDEHYYSEVYGAEIGTGLEQYVSLGQAQQHNPNDLFSESAYLAANPDVAAAVGNGGFSSGFEHFVNFGRFEERALV